MRDWACATIPIGATLRGSGMVGACPGVRDASQESARIHLTKKLPIRPLLSAASLCLLPLAVGAQTAGTVPSVPSAPEAPSLPTSPSQPTGTPYAAPQPVGGFQPAGTQASAVSEGNNPAFQLRAIAGVEHESNSLRTPSNAIGDSVFIAGVGLRADRRYGLQRFRADLEGNTYRYDKQSDLNYSVFNYALAWDWSLTPRLHGVVSADRKQYREVVTDPVALVNRVGKRTERTEVAEGTYDVGAALRLQAGATHTESSSNVANSWDGSPSIDSARVGVGYELGSGSSIYVRYRHGNGHYTDPTAGATAGDFHENQSELAVHWPATGKTTVDASIGHLQRRHDNGSQRDFSGAVGNAAVSWDVTGKTRVVAGVSRDLSATGLATGGHVESTRYYIGPVWKATAKIAVNARYDRVARDWRDVPAGSVDIGRNEAVQMLSAGIEWGPRRWLAVTGYVRGERQTSNVNTGYRNTTIGAAVKAYF